MNPYYKKKRKQISRLLFGSNSRSQNPESNNEANDTDARNSSFDSRSTSGLIPNIELEAIEQRSASPQPSTSAAANLSNNAEKPKKRLPFSIDALLIDSDVPKKKVSFKHSPTLPKRRHASQPPTLQKQPNLNNPVNSLSTNQTLPMSPMERLIQQFGTNNSVKKPNASNTTTSQKKQQVLQVMSAQQCPQLFQIHPIQAPVALTTQNIQQMLFNFSTLNQIQQINAAQLAQALILMNSVNPIQNVPIFPVPFVQIANTSRKHPLNGNCSAAQQPQSRNISGRRPLHPTRHINAPAQQSTSNPSLTNASANQHSPSESPPDPEQQTEEQLICEWAGCMQHFEYFNLYLAHVSRHIQAQTDNTCRWNNCERNLEPFALRYMLVLHVRKHTKEKPHVCPFEGCDKSYPRLEGLKTHFRTHSGDRPYRCGHCLKCFSNASDRAKHQNRTHSNEKAYACPIQNCDESYTDPSSLRKHIKTQHGEDVYDVAKENKAKNGKRGNYGFIPANQVSKNSTVDVSNFPSTSRAPTYQSTSPLENSSTNSSPDPQSNDSARQSNEGNERALSTKDLLGLETHKLETDFSNLMPVDRSIDEFVDVQVRACLQPIQNVFQHNVCSSSNGMNSDQFNIPNCADNLPSTSQLKNFEIKKEPKCSQCVGKQECDCKTPKMPPSANK